MMTFARILAVFLAALALEAFADAPAVAGARLGVTLSDGSFLVGTSTLQKIPFVPDGLPGFDISVSALDIAVVSGTEREATVNFANGDHLHGRFDPSVTIPLQTLVGPITVPISAVADIRAFPAGSLSVMDWVPLPFPTGVNWDSADRGAPVEVRDLAMVLRGQPAGTKNWFSGARTFECDVTLDKMVSRDGCFWILLIPDGSPPEAEIPPRNVAIQFGYHAQAAGSGMFAISRPGGGNAKDLGKGPFDFVAGKPSHIKLEISANAIRATLDGTTYEDDGELGFEKYRIELIGWQPSNTWTVQHITVR